jgi:hypothetical protein
MDCFRGSEEPVDLKRATMDKFERFGVVQAPGAFIEGGLVQQTEDQGGIRHGIDGSLGRRLRRLESRFHKAPLGGFWRVPVD